MIDFHKKAEESKQATELIRKITEETDGVERLELLKTASPEVMQAMLKQLLCV